LYGHPRTRIAVVSVLGLLLVATAGGWHQHLCDADLAGPSAKTWFDCPLCTLLHHKVFGTAAVPVLPPVFFCEWVFVPCATSPPRGERRSGRPPRGPPPQLLLVV
jgi:hypothetical protein